MKLTTCTSVGILILATTCSAAMAQRANGVMVAADAERTVPLVVGGSPAAPMPAVTITQTDNGGRLTVTGSLPYLSNMAAVIGGRPAAPDQAAQNRIAGGFPAKAVKTDAQTIAPDQFPWQVALVAASLNDSFLGEFCGGALIAPYWVITAAHCVAGLDPTQVEVLDGTTDLTTGGHRLRVASLAPNKDYDPYTHANDIALVRLADPEQYLQPHLQLPTADTPPQTQVSVSGWGATIYGGAITRTLEYVVLDTIDSATCKNADALNISGGMICAGAAGKDACQGDSGGALVDRSADKNVLVGIVSFGPKCAEPGKYGVYTSVWHYLGWVKQVMQSS